ncbi:hypothetical protein AMJ50_00285 [Parcubacteria bacterium DG_74_3]|nr:MAG: hypothetical protein AMJ50_00285 [Parcubacteria bacterium DG_74_3]
MDYQNFFQIFILWILSRGIKVALVLIVACLASQLANILIRKLIRPLAKEGSRIKGIVDEEILKQREKTLEGVFISIVSVVIWLTALFMILPEFGINTTPLLAGSGIVGLAVGMASSSLIRDYISGLFILLEDQYRVGEKVNLVGIQGKVKNLNLRRTVLEDSTGAIHYIPNGQITKVANFSRSKKSQK